MIMETNSEVKQTSAWKANLSNGLIMACIGIVYTIVMYFLNLTFDKAQGYIFYFIQIAVLFCMLKNYRDKYKGGYISFGESVGAGAIIYLVYAVIMSLFMYVLYKYIDPSLIDQTLANAQDMLSESGIAQEQIDMAIEMQQSMVTPGFIAISSIFSYFLYGLVFSMVVSIFVKKSKNPIFD